MRCITALAILIFVFAMVPQTTEAYAVKDVRRFAFEETMRNPDGVYQRIKTALAKQCKCEGALEATFAKTSVSRLLGGYIEGMDVTMTGGLIDTCRLDHARLIGKGVLFDVEALYLKGEFVVKGAKRIDLEAVVSEEAFNVVLKGQAKNLRVGNPQIRLLDDRLIFSGNVKTLFLRSRVRAVGKLSVKDAGKINFSLSGLKLASVPVPGFLVRSMVRRLNPIADFSKFGFWKNYNLNLRSIRIEKGKLILSSFTEGEGPQGIQNEDLRICDAPKQANSKQAIAPIGEFSVQ